MNTRTYLMISGIVFALVAALHVLRIMKGTAVMFGPWLVPMTVSWAGLIIAGALSLTAFKLTCCCKEKGP